MATLVPVNEMLHDEITKLNYTLIPPGFQGDQRTLRMMQESLSNVINQLGEQSAAAQGLNKTITTADKLSTAPSHILYLLKDAEAKGGAGEVIGLLKVGRKHLFLFDERDKVCEVEPLCVLDFYIVRDRQRHGHGRALFDRMLRDAGVQPQQLAVDGPSLKMEQFLAKNYGLERLLRQSNNFAVAPSFFDSMRNVSHPEAAPASEPAAVGRFTARKPHSSIANVIHGGGGGGYYGVTSNGGSGLTSPAAEPAAPEPEPAPAAPATPLPVPAPEPETFVSPSRPSSLRVEPLTPAAAPAAGIRSSAAPSPAGSAVARRDSQLTDLGYFDVKFYHNKLW